LAFIVHLPIILARFPNKSPLNSAGLGKVRVEYFALIFSISHMLARTFAPRQLVMLTALAVSTLSLGGCTTQTPPNNQGTPVLTGPPSTTFPMPPLSASSELGWVQTQGARAKLGDFRGEVLVLDFYATWCAPCRASIPRLIALEQKYAGNGLHLVGLNVGGPDDRVKVAAFAKELHIQYPLGFPDQALTDFFLSDNQTIPQTFVFGRGGQLLRRFIGYDEATGVEMEKVIIAAVNNR
jgi:cytochrome c biogenesis protein CcmG/thiol:disulfide interchange protein DsbE